MNMMGIYSNIYLINFKDKNMKQYYFVINDQQLGPISLNELKKEKITKETKIWYEGLDEWIKASELEELKVYFKTTPPPLKNISKKEPPPINKGIQPNLPPLFNKNTANTKWQTNNYIDKWLYFWIILAGNLLSLIISIYLLSMYTNYINLYEKVWDYEEDTILLIVSWGFSITSIVFVMKFIYKKWKFLANYGIEISPSKAVGFLFIPFFNFYWIFIVFRNYALVFNKILKNNQLSPSLQIPIGLATALPIVVLVSFLLQNIPVLGILFSLGNLALILIYMYIVCDKINSINNLQHKKDI